MQTIQSGIGHEASVLGLYSDLEEIPQHGPWLQASPK